MGKPSDEQRNWLRKLFRLGGSAGNPEPKPSPPVASSAPDKASPNATPSEEEMLKMDPDGGRRRYNAKAQDLLARKSALEREMKELKSAWAEKEDYVLNKYGTVAEDHPYKTEYDQKRVRLEAERDKLMAESRALKKEGEELIEKLIKQGGPELGSMRGPSTIETVRNIKKHFERGSATVESMAFTALTLASAYFIVEDIIHIFEADSVVEGFDRAGKTGAKYASGAIEFALFKRAFGSSPVALAVQTTVSLLRDGDMAKRQDREAREAQKEDVAKQAEQQEVERDLAIARFMEKHYPGSVTMVDGMIVQKDQKIWDRTVKQIREAISREKEEKTKQGLLLGIRDGFVAERRHKFALLPDSEGRKVEAERLGIKKNKVVQPKSEKTRPEWDNMDIAESMERAEILVSYEEGFRRGLERRNAALKRAREQGLKDAKTGKPSHMDEFAKWPEVQTNGLDQDEAAGRAALLGLLLDSYKKAFESATPVQTAPVGSGTVTASQIVERDHKAAAGQRARQLGSDDGKTGKQVHIEEIQKWPEVLEVETALRGKFLAELLEIYNKAFASIAPKPAMPHATSTMTAGEMVQRDKEAAAHQRARELGLNDGKTGKQARFEEIQRWPEVMEIDPTARGKFLAQLLETYKKAFGTAATAASGRQGT